METQTHTEALKARTVSQPAYRISQSEGPCLSVSGAAALLNVSRRTIYNWLQTGKLAMAGRTPGGAVRIYKADLLLRVQ